MVRPLAVAEAETRLLEVDAGDAAVIRGDLPELEEDSRGASVRVLLRGGEVIGV